MTEKLTSAELAERIRDERKRLRLTLAAVGDWFDKPRQVIHQAEDPERIGPAIDELRTQILSRLLEHGGRHGAQVRGPLYEITIEPAGDGEGGRSKAA